MYFKILPIQKDKYTAMGMINVDADFYLEPGDEGYEKYIAEHYVTVPVIPKEGYQGKKNERGNPVSEEDYNTWIASLPTVKQLDPFCTHSIQFEHDVTEEEILWCFEFALGITHRNYLLDDLRCEKGGQLVNQDIKYSARKALYEGFGLIPESLRSDYMKKEISKVDKVSAKVEIIRNVDFAKVTTVGKYKVK